MGKGKQPKTRNYVVRKMIDRSQKAGYHTDTKKEESKYRCREALSEEELDFEDEDGEGE